MATILIIQISVTKLWICRYCEFNANSFCEYWYVTSFIFTSDKYRCLTLSSVTECHGILQTYSRGIIHPATYEISTLCALFKPNCELAAVCEWSRTRRVLSPDISLHVLMSWEIRDFLHKDSSRNIVDSVCFCWEVALYSEYAQWLDSVCFPLSFMFLLYDM